MIYNEGQNKTLDGLQEWYKINPITIDDYFYTIAGWSGTGKTTIIKAFLDSINISRKSIGVCAPTHQAKKVIANATGYNCETLQAILGLRPDTNMDNFNPNRPAFNPIAQEKMGNYRILVIDESSMINAGAWKFTKKLAFKYKVRIIFMGDPYQLTPIGEKVSKVFTSAKRITTLTEVMRQDPDNPMLPYVHLLREDVMNGTNKGINALVANNKQLKGYKGYECMEKETFTSSVFYQYLASEYQVNNNHIKFLAYTNACVEGWAQAIRTAILGSEVSLNPLNKGEILLGYSSVTRDKEIIVNNGEEGTIVNNPELIVDGRGISGYNVQLATDSGTRTMFIVDPNNDEAFRNYVTPLIADAQIDRRKWRYYYQFKENYILLRTLNYPNNKKELVKKDIYYSNAMTIHKCQGSTFNNVAFHLPNVMRSYKPDERARLLYVGLSRLSECNLIHI